MIRVGTADLKAHLSQHLKSVRNGETIVVLDRSEPIARLVPITEPGAGLLIRPARGRLAEVPLLGPLGGPDPLDQLRDERADRL